MTTIVGALFAGYGGLELAVGDVWPDAEAVWVSEVDPAASRVLAARFPNAPNLGDVTEVDWGSVEPVDVLTGGFPCQDVSTAGKRAGLRPGTRSGLWTHFAYAIDKLRPRMVVIENVRGLLSASAYCDVEPCPWCVGDDPSRAMRALGAVLGDLADLGYDAEWVGVRAADVGAPHGRFRVFVVATDTGSQARGERPGLREGDTARDGRGQSPRDDRSALLPTPRATDGTNGGPNQRGSSGDLMLPSAVALLGTPTSRDWKDGGPQENVPVNGLLGRQVWALLPTPAANDMGEGKTLEWWEEWAPRQKAADGTPAPHGRSLAIEAQRLLPTPNAADGDGGRKRSPEALAIGAHQVNLTDLPRLRWGDYAAAIGRWEAILGRTAPEPTQPGKTGAPQLSPVFVEWLMGIPAGWVTDVPGITRAQALRILGNGVVPQQAAAALRVMSTWADPPETPSK